MSHREGTWVDCARKIYHDDSGRRGSVRPIALGVDLLLVSPVGGSGRNYVEILLSIDDYCTTITAVQLQHYHMLVCFSLTASVPHYSTSVSNHLCRQPLNSSSLQALCFQRISH